MHVILDSVDLETCSAESANDAFADFITDVSDPERPDLTIEKLAGVFDVLKPHLIDAYENHIRETDQIADAPTIEIFEDIVRKARRHVAWGREVLDRLSDTDGTREQRRARGEEIRAMLVASGGVTGELGKDA